MGRLTKAEREQLNKMRMRLVTLFDDVSDGIGDATLALMRVGERQRELGKAMLEYHDYVVMLADGYFEGEEQTP